MLGPGDLWSSVGPHLQVGGVVDVLSRCCGELVYVCNLMTKAGETSGYTPADFVEALYRCGLTRELDAVILNEEEVPEQIALRYLQGERAAPVLPVEYIPRARRIIAGKLLSQDGLRIGLVRHGPVELARILVSM